MYIFGYGSLINKYTRTEKSEMNIPVRLRGYQRAWNTRIYDTGATSLGIVVKEDSICNGVLISISQNLLDEINKREEPAGYNCSQISFEALETLSNTPLPIEGEVFTHISNEQLLPTNDYPVLQTYIDTVLFGCFEYGEEFTREFIKNTKFWDSPLVNDRNDPQYPRWKPGYVDSNISKIFDDEFGN